MPRSGTVDTQDRNLGWASVNFGLLHGDRRELEALQDAIEACIGDGTDIPADKVLTELRARYADRS